MGEHEPARRPESAVPDVPGTYQWLEPPGGLASKHGWKNPPDSFVASLGHAGSFFVGFWSVGVVAVLALSLFAGIVTASPIELLFSLAGSGLVVTMVAVVETLSFHVGRGLVVLTLGWPAGVPVRRGRIAGGVCVLTNVGVCFTKAWFDWPETTEGFVACLLLQPLLLAFCVAWLRAPLAPLLRDVRESSP